MRHGSASRTFLRSKPNDAVCFISNEARTILCREALMLICEWCRGGDFDCLVYNLCSIRNFTRFKNGLKSFCSEAVKQNREDRHRPRL